MNRNELMHHGIKGMKWGIRRYQNPDGSYTHEGRKRSKEKLEKKHGQSGDKITAPKKTKRQIRKENRAAIKEKNLHKSKEIVEKNRERILKEMDEYSKKTGEDFTKKFLEYYDDIEMWDLYSPEELKIW